MNEGPPHSITAENGELSAEMRKAGMGDSVGARLTELGRHRYGAAFRTHNGRWEPLPGTGAIEEMADVVVTLLTHTCSRTVNKANCGMLR